MYPSSQLYRNIEAYMDDVIIKTQAKKDLISDLVETIESIRIFYIKLNP
jgi:hypothetical protein